MSLDRSNEAQMRVIRWEFEMRKPTYKIAERLGITEKELEDALEADPRWHVELLKSQGRISADNPDGGFIRSCLPAC